MGVSTILRTRLSWISKTVAILRGQHSKRQNAQQPKATNLPNKQLSKPPKILDLPFEQHAQQLKITDIPHMQNAQRPKVADLPFEQHLQQLKITDNPNEQHVQRLKVTDLPNEIILEVFEFVSQVSQGCFALSCRRLYHRFKYIFSAPMFRFPCFDGIDPEVNIRARNRFLSRLQVTKGNREHRWVYCYVCLKLHPWNEFDSLELNRRKFPYCKWPGLIALCPCLRFSPRKLIQLCHGLSRTGFAMDDIKRIIWHQCYFTSPCGKLSYALNTALSRQGSRVTFHFTYLINDMKHASPYQGERKIMLCPHENALDIINGSDIPKVFEELCCARARTISYSRDRGYKITFERACNIPL